MSQRQKDYFDCSVSVYKC